MKEIVGVLFDIGLKIVLEINNIVLIVFCSFFFKSFLSVGIIFFLLYLLNLKKLRGLEIS